MCIRDRHYARFSRVLAFTFLGNFFNNFLPGLISGDFLKVFYLQKSLGKPFSWQILLRALTDRALGISGLVFLGLISTFSIDQPALQASIVLLSLFLVGFWLMFSWRRKLHRFVASLRLSYLNKLKPRLDSWLTSLHDLSTLRLVLGFGLSVLIFLLQTLVLFLYAGALGSTLDWLEVIAACSLGLVASALPITPLGIGLGHLAFQSLFLSLGFAAGADLYNLFLATQLVANLPGLLVFLFPPQAKTANHALG